MGNSCECIRRQGGDEAEDALLASLVGEGTDRGPRGPPPPYQVSGGVRRVCWVGAQLCMFARQTSAGRTSQSACNACRQQVL